MPHFSASSMAKLATCHPQLRHLMQAVISEVDIVIVCGHRGKTDQEKAVASGNSKAHWPESKHNFYPSLAVDIAPYDVSMKAIPWSDHAAFQRLSEIVKQKAAELGISISWGGDWKTFLDLPHYELVGVAGTLPGEEAAA